MPERAPRRQPRPALDPPCATRTVAPCGEGGRLDLGGTWGLAPLGPATRQCYPAKRLTTYASVVGRVFDGPNVFHDIDPVLLFRQLHKLQLDGRHVSAEVHLFARVPS